MVDANISDQSHGIPRQEGGPGEKEIGSNHYLKQSRIPFQLSFVGICNLLKSGPLSFKRCSLSKYAFWTWKSESINLDYS